MTPLKSPVSFTANTLLDGEAVWLAANGQWVGSVSSASVFRTVEERDAAAEVAARADAANIVVEPYEIDVIVEAGGTVPTKFREKIRAAGPTIRLDLGKQADALATAA